MLAALRKVHAWAGLLLCVLLVPISLSGAALVFKPQWLRATVPGAAVAVDPTPAEGARAMAAAQAAFDAPRTVVFAGPRFGAHEVIGKDGGGYLSAGSPEPIARWGINERAVDWLFDLHHRLFSGEAGTAVTGYVGLLTLAMVMTGLVIWAPAWRSFRGRVAPSGGRRAGWLAAHRDLGLMSAPVLLVILATGSAVALSDLSARVMGFSRPPPPAASAGEPDWGRALTAAQTRFPGAELRMASWPASAGKPLVVRLRQPAEWHTNGRTIVYVDPATSAVLGVEDAVANQASRRLFDTFWPVHASKVGGWFWKVVTFLAGIALAALAIYGAESYRRKIFPKRARRSAAPAAL